MLVPSPSRRQMAVHPSLYVIFHHYLRIVVNTKTRTCIRQLNIPFGPATQSFTAPSTPSGAPPPQGPSRLPYYQPYSPLPYSPLPYSPSPYAYYPRPYQPVASQVGSAPFPGYYNMPPQYSAPGYGQYAYHGYQTPGTPLFAQPESVMRIPRPDFLHPPTPSVDVTDETHIGAPSSTVSAEKKESNDRPDPPRRE